MMTQHKTPSEVSAILQGMVDRLNKTCCSHSCLVAAPKGQGVNGPCQHSPRHLARELLDLAAEIEQQGNSWRTRDNTKELDVMEFKFTKPERAWIDAMTKGSTHYEAWKAPMRDANGITSLCVAICIQKDTNFQSVFLRRCDDFDPDDASYEYNFSCFNKP